MTSPYLINTQGVTVFHAGGIHTAAKDHPNYTAIIDAIKASNFDIIPELINISKAIEARVSNANIEVDSKVGVIRYKGEIVHGLIVDRILEFMAEGLDVQPLVNFMDNLYQNPSATAIRELYGFLEYGNCPITPDGCFLSYKRVRDNYTSVYDGRTDNSIGTKLEMPRHKVDDDRNRTCSTGLHFCSHEYLRSFSGSRIIVLKVNPKDVVSIPTDYNNTKGRASAYEDVGELTDTFKDTTSPYWTSPLVSDYETQRDTDWDENEDYDEDYDEDFDFLDVYSGPIPEVVVRIDGHTSSWPTTQQINSPRATKEDTEEIRTKFLARMFGTEDKEEAAPQVPVKDAQQYWDEGYIAGWTDGMSGNAQSSAIDANYHYIRGYTAGNNAAINMKW